jgi:transcriptional regulator with XRE-family HTH domain
MQQQFAVLLSGQLISCPGKQQQAHRIFMSLGKRLQDRLDSSGLTQAELADRVGLSRGMMNHLLQGNRGGSRQLHRIAKELGTTVEFLLGEDTSPEAEFSISKLTRDELAMIFQWRFLNTDQQGAVRVIIQSIVSRRQG